MFESNVILNRFKTLPAANNLTTEFESNVILNRFKTKLLVATKQA